MPNEFVELPGSIALATTNELIQVRSMQLLEAITTHRDFTLVSVAQFKRDDNSLGELIYVDVECDAVVPNNTVGIQFRERLAIYVPLSQQDLIEVFPLRKNFPNTQHRSQNVTGFPTSLCLYLEPQISIARTWTAPRFLRRIQWWLQKTAVNQLHPEDQPVENIYFVTPYDLILPFNFKELREDTNVKLQLIRSEQRFDKSITFFIKPSNKNTSTGITNYIHMTLAPVVHGVVERHPETLGELSESLQQRGIDFVAYLKNELSKQVPSSGLLATHDNDCTILVLEIPICRTVGEAPETVQHKAFYLSSGALSLGVSLNFLFLMDGKYFNVSQLGANENTAWKGTPICSLDVRYQNDIDAFRQQSGTNGDDPKITLIGAGALGSMMLDLWARAGWGHWTLIDKDYIKPHNITRHIAYAQHIGRSKADVVAELYRCIVEDARDIAAINADAINLAVPEVIAPLKASDLVIDASTTLEYPRAASQIDELGRHISLFITPTGKSAVLLAEDTQRTIRLRSLEAQYYRALLQQPWGERHLEGNISRFWSGASCRDISFVLPHIHITAHAATLAEQCTNVSLSDQARIYIWDREIQSGAITFQEVMPYTESKIEASGCTIYIDNGVRNQLFNMRQHALPNETGGVLLGYFDFNINALIVVCGLPAPEDSISTPTSFVRGVKGVHESVTNANHRTAGIVSYIGEWHSHPTGCSVMPSGDDLEQVAYLIENMATDGLPAIQIIVGDNEFSVIFGENKINCRA